MASYRVINADGQRVSVTKEDYLRLVGDRQTAPYAKSVREGKMSLDAVPEEYREEVAAIVSARTAFSGEYRLSANEVLAEIREVLE